MQANVGILTTDYVERAEEKSIHCIQLESIMDIFFTLECWKTIKLTFVLVKL